MLPKFFNMIAGFGFDYMHGILLCMSANCGLTKFHLELWYMGRDKEQIDKSLLAIH